MKRVTGTYDVYGDYGYEFRKLEDYLYELATLYNFEYIKTPILEESSLYHREKNNTNDFIAKHTYDFKDLSGKNMTLRPECNSGIVRAIMENKLYTELPKKYYYYGDVFRYDKPQKGRYREFTQFGFEIIGSENYIVDAEMMSLAYNIYRNLGVHNITLKLNSLGNSEDICKYRSQLIKYFSKYIDVMCDDCKRRFRENPLRILSCKNNDDRKIISNAPSSLDAMSIDSLQKFQNILKILDIKNVPYKVDKSFIRGIDYQNDMIFEIINNNNLGSQNDLCGGGRYDNLYLYLTGKKIPAFGFDFGLERLITCIKSENSNFFDKKNIDLFIVNIGENLIFCLQLEEILRKNGIVVDFDMNNRSFKSQLKYSDQFMPKYTLFIGDDEVKTGILKIRNNKTMENFNVNINELLNLFHHDEGKRKCLKK